MTLNMILTSTHHLSSAKTTSFYAVSGIGKSPGKQRKMYLAMIYMVYELAMSTTMYKSIDPTVVP